MWSQRVRHDWATNTSGFVIAFLPRSKCLIISWLQVTINSDFGAQENKTCHCFHIFPFYFPWSNGTGFHDLSFFIVEFQASFFTLLLHPHQEAFLVPFHFLLLEWQLITVAKKKKKNHKKQTKKKHPKNKNWLIQRQKQNSVSLGTYLIV